MLLNKKSNRPVTLFFIVSAVATAFEEAQIEKLHAKPRSAKSYSSDDALEKADFLAGAIPAGLVERMEKAGYKFEVIPQEAPAAPEPSQEEQDRENYEAGARYGASADGVLPEGAPDTAVQGFNDARRKLLANQALEGETAQAAAPVVTEEAAAPSSQAYPLARSEKGFGQQGRQTQTQVSKQILTWPSETVKFFSSSPAFRRLHRNRR